jgi:hypothetical protein
MQENAGFLKFALNKVTIILYIWVGNAYFLGWEI